MIRNFPRDRWAMAALSLGIVFLIGIADYATGYEISFSIFYLLAIVLAAWFSGKVVAIGIAVLSVAIALAGDLAAGATYSSRLVPAWNASITFGFYLLFVWAISRLKSFQEQLEGKVRARTAALSSEMAVRQALERSLLSVSEREQQRIGNDLHDSLCQHLTGTALAARCLQEKLETGEEVGVADAHHVVELIGEGIDMARGLARGLFPVLQDKEGLMSALTELAATTREISGLDCVFQTDRTVAVEDNMKATHLFRIAQEAVRNAVKHSRGSRVVIACSEDREALRLWVSDNGRGMEARTGENHHGMGLQIMKHRAAMIGGALQIRSDARGTTVTCMVEPREGDQPPDPAQSTQPRMPGSATA